MVFNANLGAIGAGIFFVALNACILEILLVIKSPNSYANYYSATLSSIIPLGAVFGGLASSFLADQFGRRKIMIIMDVLTIIGCALSVIANPYLIILGRVLCGIITGVNYMVIPLYVREISPPNMSGRAGSYFRIFFTLGIFITFLIALGLQKPANSNDELWRVIFALPCVFALSRTIIFLGWLKLDTPKYYLETGQESNALAALMEIYREDQVDQVFQREKKYEKASYFDVFRYQYRRQMVLIVLLIFATEFMGANALNFYTSSIFLGELDPNVRADDIARVRTLNVVFASVRFLASILGKYMIDKFGRRPLLIYGSLMSIFIAGLTAFSETVDFLIAEQSLIILYTAIQGLTFTLVLPVYTAELLPSFGIALQVVVQMFSIMVVTVAFPFVTIRTSFLVFAIVGAVTFIPIFKFAKETKSKTLNEVYRAFHAEKGSGLLDEEVGDDSNDGL